MGDDIAELIRSLCTRAGMIMEDLSSAAILVGTDDSGRQEQVVAYLERAGAAVTALAAAARVLLQPNES